MQKMLVTTLLVSAAGALLVAQALPAQAQDDRIRDLERRVEQLEKRLSTTTTLSNEEKGGKGGAGGWRNKANWRMLKRGMTEGDVRSLLGEPQKVDVGVVLVFWYYNFPTGGSVQFGTDNHRVSGWSEP